MKAFASTLALVISLASAAPCAAQMYPFSQRGSVGQTLAFTKIAIEYGRPTARGRTLFGALVPYDSVWHPGADNATSISFAHDVVVETHPVKAGTYSVWLIPRERTAWTFILNRAINVSHTPYPGADKDVLRVDVMPNMQTFVETLTYSFPVVQKDEATLRIQWGESGIGVRIKAPYQPVR